MKIRIPVYLAALASLAVVTADDASADTRGKLPHRTAPHTYHPITIIKPVVSHPIKFGRAQYQARPRR